MRRSLLLLSAMALACSGGKSPHRLVILHTNDEHSHLLGFSPELDDFPTPAAGGSGIRGGAARRAAIFENERATALAAGADSITVSAGDNMMGTLAQIAATSLSPDYRIMKALGYDVTTLGNHEFDYGPAGLSAAIDAAQVSITGLPATAVGLPPIVASNIHFSGTSGDAALAAKYDPQNTDSTKPIHGKYVITTKGGLKIGFIGIMGADAQAVAPAAAPVHFSLPTGTDKANRVAVLAQIFDDVKPYVDSLRRDDKVDLVVALSHSGAELAADGSASGEDIAIAQNVAGIDVVISGHSHTEVPLQLVTNLYTGRPVAVQQAGRFGDTVGKIPLTVNEDGTILFDLADAGLIPVKDTTAATNATVNAVVGATINALESQNISADLPFSFLRYTLAEILHGTPPALVNLGDYYNFQLATLLFDVDNSSREQETELIDLSADAMLTTANQIAPTDIAVEASGTIRTSALRKGATGKLGLADLFIAVPLGGSPVSGTPGYPLCRFGVYLAEVKAAFEVTAAFSYSDNDFFLVPSGFKFEYDTTRPPFNPSGSGLDPMNGRVTRIWQLKPSALAAGILDGPDATTWDLKFDGRTIASPGFLESPLTLKRGTATLYFATFATFAGVTLKDPTTGAPVPGNDPTRTILLRPLPAPNNTEIKEWEALGGYVHALGTLPPIYDRNTANAIPRRAICTGANAVSGNCSH